MQKHHKQLVLPFEPVIDVSFFDRQLQEITNKMDIFLDSLSFQNDEELHFDDWFHWYKPHLTKLQQKKAEMFIKQWQEIQEKKLKKQICVNCSKYTPTFFLVKTVNYFLCIHCLKKQNNR